MNFGARGKTRRQPEAVKYLAAGMDHQNIEKIPKQPASDTKGPIFTVLDFAGFR